MAKTRPNVVSFAMQPWNGWPSGTCLPRLAVRLKRNGQSIRFGALVDSGASYTLVVRSVARALRINEDELNRAPRITWRDASGNTVEARGLLITIESDADALGRKLLVEDALVHFTEASLPYDVLLGQHDFLERILFAQANQKPTPHFSLREPPV